MVVSVYGPPHCGKMTMASALERLIRTDLVAFESVECEKMRTTLTTQQYDEPVATASSPCSSAAASRSCATPA